MKKRNYLTMITSLIAFGFCFTLIACDNGENPSDSTSGNISNSDSSLSDESSSSEVLKYYNVVFNPNNGEDTYSYEVLENDKVLNNHLHKLQGHTFLGWYNNDQLFDITTSKITEDITLEAKWSANEYTINFVLSGGSCEYSSLKVTYGSEYTLPEVSKQGYTFTGWTLNNKEFVSGIYSYTNDITITANYTVNNYELTYYSNIDGNNEKTTMGVIYNQSVYLPTLNQTGHNFLGWYFNDEKVQIPFSYSYTENITLQAKWELQKYNISLDLNGGESDVNELVVEYNKEFTLPTPTKENHKFVGWYLYNTLFTDGVYNKTHGISLKAKWEELPKYTVSYLHDDKVLFTDVVYINNTYKIREFEDIEGYNFLYWTSNGNRYYPNDTFVYDFDYNLTLECYLETPDQLQMAVIDAQIEFYKKVIEIKKALEKDYLPENEETDMKPFIHLSIDERNAVAQMIDLVEMGDYADCKSLEDVSKEKEKHLQILENIVLLARLEGYEEKELLKEIARLDDYDDRFSYKQINAITDQFLILNNKYKFIDSFYSFTIGDEELLHHVLSLNEQELLALQDNFDNDVADLANKYYIIYKAREYTQSVVDDVNYRLTTISNALANDYGYQFRVITNGKEFLEIPTELSYQEVLKLAGTLNDDNQYDINTKDGHIGEINKIYQEALDFIDSIEGKCSKNEAINKIRDLESLSKAMKDEYVKAINDLGDVTDIYEAMQEAKENGLPYQNVLKDYLDDINKILGEAITHDETMKVVYEYVEENNLLWVKDYTDLLSIRGFSNAEIITSGDLNDKKYGYATIVISKDGTIIYATINDYNELTPEGTFYHDGTFKVENGITSSIFKFSANYDGTLKDENENIIAGKGEFELVLPEGASLITGSKSAMDSILNKIGAFNNVDDVINAKKGSLNKVEINDLFDTFSNTHWQDFATDGDKLVKETYDALMNCKIVEDAKNIEEQFKVEYKVLLNKYDELYKELDNSLLKEQQVIYLDIIEKRINEELTKLDDTETMYSLDLLRYEYRDKVLDATYSYELDEMINVEFEEKIAKLID